jgi:hypothetical protein
MREDRGQGAGEAGISDFSHRKSVTIIKVWPLGYFTQISITAPVVAVVSALKKLLYLEL